MQKTMYAGVDIGSTSCESVVFDGNRVISNAMLPTGSLPRKSGESVLEIALRNANVNTADLLLRVATGYGRNLLANAKPVTEITCYARGARFLHLSTEMIIDIGGQDSKVILLDQKGNITDFLTNDKCAAGTGRFLETIARALNMQVDEMALRGLDTDPAQISNTCGVFAESEVVGLLASEVPIDNIIAGIHKSVADRTLSIVNRFGTREHIMFCGGVSKNTGVRSVLEKALGENFFVPDEPQMVGALGAAIIASEEYHKSTAL